MLATVVANGETHTLDLDRMLFAEGRAIEKVTGSTFGEFGQAMQAGSLTAIQALVWVAVKRTHPETKFSDLDEWEIGAVELTVEDEEAEADPTEAATPAA